MSNPMQIGEHKVRELVNQKAFCLEAVNGLNAALAASGTGGVAPIFREIHSILTHAGNISKILWGNGRHRAQYDLYRKELGLQERLWALQSRSLRNALEHYDERLESWGERNVVVDLNVGPKEAFSFGKDSEVTFDRHFDNTSMVFSIRDDSINLQHLTNEVVEIGIIAEASLGTHQ